MRLQALVAGSGIAGVLLSGCTSSGPAIPAAPFNTSAIAAPQNHRDTEQVRFEMRWPAHRVRATIHRRPQYVSPSTMSLAVRVNNRRAIIINNPSKKGKPITATVAIPAPVGKDTFTISLWDRRNATGDILGQTIVSQRIIEGRLNTLRATIDGVLASIRIGAAPNQPFLETGQSGGSPVFTLVGDQAANFFLAPLDAAGNVIVAPGTIPSLSLSSLNPAITVKAVDAAKSEYSVQLTGRSRNAKSSLTASGIDGNGFTATTSVPLTLSAALYVAFQNSGTGSIEVLDQFGHRIATSGAFAGVKNPAGVAYDPDDRLLIVADAAGKLLSFDENGGTKGTFAPVSFAGASAVAYDGSTKQIFVTSSSGNAVGVFTPNGTPVSVAGTFSGLNAPNGIAVAGGAGSSSGYVYVTNGAAGVAPSVFNPDGTAASAGVNQDVSFTSAGIAYDSAQNLIWISSNAPSGAQLTGYQSNGNALSMSATYALNGPFGVAFNPINDEIYAINAGLGTIGAFTDASPYQLDANAGITLAGPATNPTGIAIVP